MNKILKTILTVLACFGLAACGEAGDKANNARAEDEVTDTQIEADTAITQDPDTSTYHDMTL